MILKDPRIFYLRSSSQENLLQINVEPDNTETDYPKYMAIFQMDPVEGITPGIGRSQDEAVLNLSNQVEHLKPFLVHYSHGNLIENVVEFYILKKRKGKQPENVLNFSVTYMRHRYAGYHLEQGDNLDQIIQSEIQDRLENKYPTVDFEIRITQRINYKAQAYQNRFDITFENDCSSYEHPNQRNEWDPIILRARVSSDNQPKEIEGLISKTIHIQTNKTTALCMENSIANRMNKIISRKEFFEKQNQPGLINDIDCPDE